MVWRLSLVPRKSVHRDELVRKLTAVFPAMELNNFPDLPFASPEIKAEIARRGNPIGGRLQQETLTIDLQFAGTPESVTALDFVVHGLVNPLPTLREIVRIVDGTLTDIDMGTAVNVQAEVSPEWESLFHSLRLRVGVYFGALRPTLSQVDEVIEDIETGRDPYGGFAIEDAAERRDLPRLHVVRVLYEGSHQVPNHWCLHFSEGRDSWTMCTELKVADEIVDGMEYGCPMQFRKRCLLTRHEVLEGVSYFLEHRSRNPHFAWIDMGEAYNLSQ